MTLMTKILVLQSDAFCEPTMNQNATAAGAPPRTPLWELTALPDPLADFKGAALRWGREGRGGSRRKGKRGKGPGGREGTRVMATGYRFLKRAMLQITNPPYRVCVTALTTLEKLDDNIILVTFPATLARCISMKVPGKYE